VAVVTVWPVYPAVLEQGRQKDSAAAAVVDESMYLPTTQRVQAVFAGKGWID